MGLSEHPRGAELCSALPRSVLLQTDPRQGWCWSRFEVPMILSLILSSDLIHQPQCKCPAPAEWAPSSQTLLLPLGKHLFYGCSPSLHCSIAMSVNWAFFFFFFLKAKDFNLSLGAILASGVWRFPWKSGSQVGWGVRFLHRIENCVLHGEVVSKYWGNLSAGTVWKLFHFSSSFSLYK